jgi:hypothetical protein
MNISQPPLKITAAIVLGLALLLCVSPIMIHIITNPTPENISNICNNIQVVGYVLLVIGSCIYTKSIGYSAFLGLISLSCLGFAFLMLLPDRIPEESKEG